MYLMKLLIIKNEELEVSGLSQYPLQATEFLFSASAPVVVKRTSTGRSATLAAVAKWTRQRVRLARCWRE